jgi:hypothetical protein
MVEEAELSLPIPVLDERGVWTTDERGDDFALGQQSTF